MDQVRGNGSSKHRTVRPESTKSDEDPLIQGQSSMYSSHFLASSSSNQLDMDKNDLSNSFTNDGPTPDHSLLSPSGVPSQPQWSMMSASPREGTGQPAGYDPNRIPSSVFASKPSTPMEWSVASNESLFSIHTGNNSFSTDNPILLRKSGELGRYDEWKNYNYPLPDAKSGGFDDTSTGLQPVMESVAVNNDRKSASIEEELTSKNEVLVSQDMLSRESMKKHDEEKLAHEKVQVPAANLSVLETRSSASTPRLSDESGNSAGSFAFPVFVGGGSMKAENEKPPTPKSHQQPQTESQPKTPSAKTPKSSTTRWFCCFSRCTLCC